MPPRARVEPGLSELELLEWVRAAESHAAYQRWLAVWLTYLRRFPAHEVATLLGVSPPAVWRWLSPFDGGCTSLILPWVDTQTMTLFLRHTSQEFAAGFCRMLLDGAGWHRAQNLVLPDNLRLLFLPPSSPELNPVEQVWEYLRANHFGNDTFATLESVGERPAIGLRSLGEQPNLVGSLTSVDWLHTIRLSSN